MSDYGDNRKFHLLQIDNIADLRSKVEKHNETSRLKIDSLVDLTIRPSHEDLQIVTDLSEEIGNIIALGGAFNKQKLEVTSMPNGVFDFSLASQGLFRPIEYYSEKLKEENPSHFEHLELPSGIVPPNLVQDKHIKSTRFFYYENDGVTYECVRRQEGTTEILNHSHLGTDIVNGIEIPEDGVTQVDNGKYKLQFRTRNKKCYLRFKKAGGGKPLYVDLYLFASQLNLNDRDALLYVMPTILSAQVLENAGVKTKISVLRWQEGNEPRIKGNGVIGMSVGVKDYGEPFDLGLIARVIGEESLSNIFSRNAYAKFFKEKGHPDFYGYGSAPYNDNYKMDNYMKRYYNFIREAYKSGKTYSKADNPSLTLFGTLGNYPEVFTPEELKRTILQKTEEILDKVDIEVNELRDSIARIADRLKEKGLGKSQIRRYITNLVTRSYLSYPDKGDYAFSPTEIREFENKANDVLAELGQHLE